jgi:hypothetical protein
MSNFPRPIFSRFLYVAALAVMASELSIPLRAVGNAAETTSYRLAIAVRSTGEAQVIVEDGVGAYVRNLSAVNVTQRLPIS